MFKPLNNKWFFWQFTGIRWAGAISMGSRPEVKGGYLQSGGGLKFPATDPVNISAEPYNTMSLDSLKVCFPNPREQEDD